MGIYVMIAKPTFSRLLQEFFTRRLISERQVSIHTISSYRDTFRMLLRFMISRLNKSPSKIEIEDIDAPLISAFLDELENKRRITARSRNVRLAAIRSFFNFLALEMPERSSQIQRVLAMPCKAYIHRAVSYLTRPEIDAILAMPNQKLWSGRGDHIMLLIAVQTGARLSEITGLTYQDVVVGTGAHIKIMGKGRKERAIPLAKNASAALQVWMQEPRTGANKILFPNAKGSKLSADGVQYILRKHVASAQNICPTLKGRRVSVHPGSFCFLTEFSYHQPDGCPA